MTTTAAIVKQFTLAAVVCLGMAWPALLDAQLFRGTARVVGSQRPLDRARIVAMRLDGTSIGSTSTDENGRFSLQIDSRGNVFVIAVVRLGMQATTSEEMMVDTRDTLDVDFMVTEIGIVTDTVKVTAAPSLNETRLKEAERRGWRVFPPAEVARLRERANSFEDLLRSTGYPGLVIPSRRDDCIRTTRYNECLTIVIDGVPLSGSYPNINPRDIYFFAVLGKTEASVQFGDRAPWGAIVLYTRSRMDRD